MALDFATLETPQKSHPAWRLLMADHASLLEGVLYEHRREQGPEAYTRDAASYLESWAQESHGWLRKYYPPGAAV